MADVEATIRQYIASHFEDGVMPFAEYLDEIMDTLRPLCSIAATGVYPLARVEEVDHHHVAIAIAKATGRTVDRIVVVSASHPFPQPNWMSAAVYHDHRTMILWDELIASLRCTVGEDVASQRIAQYGVDRVTSVRDVVSTHLGVPVGLGIARALGWGKSLGDDILTRRIMQLGIVQGGIIVPYVTAATLGDTDTLEQLYQLMLLLPRVLAMGERVDTPGAWLALAA
ncbi:MAG: hypothetical protein Q8R16_04180 [bacterium]|nr:hypothetical protein [bacterium]